MFDTNLLISLISQGATIGAAVVLIVTQLFKWKVVPVVFANKYPVPTNIVLSALATIGIFLVNHASFDWHNVPVMAATLFSAAVGAAIGYNQLASNWPALKDSETPKSEV